MAVTARLRALTKKPKRLQALADNLLGEVVQLMDQQLDTAIAVLRTEPPPKAGSSYVRTHTYSRNWTRSDVRLTGSGVIGTVQNPVRYAQFVGGNETGVGQSDRIAPGWPLVAEALRVQGGITFATRLRNKLGEF